LTKVREAVAAFELTVEEVFGIASKSAKKKASKSAAPKRTQKGAGQAKYRDAKSGAVWTGFGRAPA
jgi:DNA-binding protein H-NS